MKIIGVILAILAFGFLVFIHELGHFIAAKTAKVKVNEFSIGMGPVLLSRKKGETQYSLRAFPIGGFVAMEGEDEDSADSRSFTNTSLPRRAIIMLAGVTMNFIFGLLLMLLLTGLQVQQPGALIPQPQIGGFHENASTDAWLQEGDIFVTINGKKIRNYSDVAYRVARDEDGHMDMVVLRNGEKVALSGVQFDFHEIDEGVNSIYLDFIPIGVEPTFLNTIDYGFQRTGLLMKQIWMSLVDLVSGRVGFNQLSGPVGITKEMSKITSAGDWQTSLVFVAMLSLNLGIFNLLPLPALDGGKLFFLLIEALRGKPANPKIEMAVNFVGIMLLLGLMLVVTLKDVVTLFQ